MPKRAHSENFIRDGRAPVPSDFRVSLTMSRIRHKNTLPEVALRKALYGIGIKGYRLHRAELPGRPDIVFLSKRVAIFVNGCFWHRCPHCSPSFPHSNKAFWEEKFNRNVERDKNNVEMLMSDGWTVLTVWECQIRKNLSACVARISELMKLERHDGIDQ